MKRVFLLYVLVIIGNISNADVSLINNLDSLKSQLLRETDSGIRADIYLKMAKLFSNNSDSSLYYAHQYLHSAIQTKDSLKIADAYYQIADIYYYFNYDSTLFYSNKYLEISLLTGNQNLIAYAYELLAYTYSQNGEIPASLEYYQKALDYFTQSKDSSRIAACYNNIGYSISFGKEQDKGLQFFLQGLNIAETIKDTFIMSDGYYNVAYYYSRIKDYQASFDYYQKSLNLSLNYRSPDSIGIALTYAIMADASLKLNRNDDFYAYMKLSKNTIPFDPSNYDLADLYSCYIENYIEISSIDSTKHYLRLIENILNENSFEIINAYTLQHKGRLAFLEKKYEESINYLNKSIQLFMKNNSIESFSDTYAYIAKAYAALNRHKEAYVWQIKANSFRDTLNMGAVERVLTEFEQNKVYTIELQRKQLEMELEQQRIQNSNIQIRTKYRVSIAALFLLSVFILLAIAYYRTIHKNNTLLFQKNEIIEKQKQMLEEHVESLKNNEIRLQELNATKDKFFSIIAHDLRNPFHSIIGLSDLLLNVDDPVDPENRSKIIVSMNKTANYGFSLLENLLEWSKSQTGIMIPNPEALYMDKILLNLISDFKVLFESKQINIKFESENPPPVFADKNMIITVVRNLLHNAIKFSYDNSTITIQTEQKNDHLVTSIRDEGMGITAEDLSKLFVIESQVIKAGTHKEKGSGLGLILCKEFIEKNGGTITVEGQKNKGCTFSFSLPLFIENVG